MVLPLATLIAQVVIASATSVGTTLTLDPATTKPSFDVVSFGFIHTHGIFSGATGDLIVDAPSSTARITATIPAASLKTGSSERDAFLKGKEFFNVNQFADVTVTAAHISLIGSFPRTVDGTLTMRGITRPISLSITSLTCTPLMPAAPTLCNAHVTTTIQRSDWGMSHYRFIVGNAVTINVDIMASVAP